MGYLLVAMADWAESVRDWAQETADPDEPASTTAHVAAFGGLHAGLAFALQYPEWARQADSALRERAASDEKHRDAIRYVDRQAQAMAQFFKEKLTGESR